MTRLTNETRDKIVTNAINKAVGQRKSGTLKNLADAFSEKLVEIAVGDKLHALQNTQKKIDALISAIPENFKNEPSYSVVNTDTSVRLNIAGQAVDWYFDKETVFPRTSWGNRYVIPQGSPLVELMDEYRIEEKKINDIKSSVHANVKALVYSVNTVKRLLEVWPEAAALIPVEMDKPVVNLPSIKIEELNTLIGVPSDK